MSDSPSEPKSGSSTIYIIVIGVLILLIIGTLGGFVLTWLNKYNCESEEVVPNCPRDCPCEPEPSPPSPTPTVEKTGIWARLIPNNDYGNHGLNFEASKGYCQSHDARLVTKDELLSANNLGFQYCSAGWLEGGEKGYVMREVVPNCGNKTGWVGWGGTPADPLNTYCMGKIPTTEETGASFGLCS